ncbi:hypothetical protein [Cryobacterium psychrophilum]|uniref:Uncharacterized protein n=1 Tax=Cryobacterium psychrophilum TaxID=41988 RepID=A0A4Y8KNZ1_9MICO|nr:hypothetical protein [Cryobacterium psychrophilum]TDW31281.1 hypothetical protein EDD25_3085 [Cryobacterium psychrophilum]TFD78432.1 hypothetical protein E3T53_09560 [Cryobacterium psychrophilum]
MSWLSTMFGNHEGNTGVETPVEPELAFTERVTASLNTLAADARLAGAVISTTAFSQLRSIDDVIRPLLAYIAGNPVPITDQIAIESLVSDYVPTSLRLFLLLPPEDQTAGDPADLLLHEQFTALETSARRLSATIIVTAASALETHAIFLQNKFNG